MGTKLVRWMTAAMRSVHIYRSRSKGVQHDATICMTHLLVSPVLFILFFVYFVIYRRLSSLAGDFRLKKKNLCKIHRLLKTFF